MRLPFPPVFLPLFALCVLVLNSVRAQAPSAEAAAQQALQLFNNGKTKEAADAYAGILKSYPNATVAFEAQFRLGYLDYLLGDYDKSLELLKKCGAAPTPPEIQELAASLTPQVLAAKASKLPPGAPQTAAFEDAIKQFDAFMQKYPNSEEVESANYGRAVASFQIGKFDDAAKSLRDNLQRFAKSESVLDSQYLLALTFAAQASATDRAPDATAEAHTKAAAQFEQGANLLRDIVQKRSDVALANDAQFQLGEILFNRAAASNDSARRPALFNDAIAAYRAVQPKSLMVKAQEQRLVSIAQRMPAAVQARSLPEIRRLQRLQEHEQPKLSTIAGGTDKTVSAAIKVGICFFIQQQFDAARVLFRQYGQFAEDDEQKKQILYYTTMSYGSQRLVDQALAGYDEFQKKYEGDPIADNLPLAIGAMFLGGDPKTNNPEKALQYFKDSIRLYPKGRFVNESVTQEANALLQLKRYDEAQNSFKTFLASNPRKELAAAAEFGIASINKDVGTVTKDAAKIEAALGGFKSVRDKYAGLPQAESAAFWVGQLLLQKGDAKGAVTELKNFLKSFPESDQMPAAMLTLGQAEAGSGDKNGALQTYKDLQTKYPKSAAAPYTYFFSATILGGDQKTEEMLAEMRKFIETYPNDDKIYFAYDSIGQNLINAQKPLDAVAIYSEMAEKHPDNPQASQALYQISELWRRYAEGQGRYIALNEEQRAEWNKGMTGSTGAVEKLLQQYPDAPQVAAALQTLLQDEKLLAAAKLKTSEEVEKYFQDLAGKFEAKPGTKSKILFTLASFTFERDKVKALAEMQAAYDPKLVYAEADIDLYGGALLDSGKAEEALAVYQKLGADYPTPPGVAPEKAPRAIADAQATSLFGIGKALQKQNKIAEASQKFDQLKKLYPWSSKILEANFGIAESLVQQNKFDEALPLLLPIMRSTTATNDLHAHAMLLGGEIQEKKNNLEAAIDYYIKIAAFYEAVAPVAAEGLWRGGQLLEKQAATLPEKADDPKKPTKPGQMARALRAYKDLADKYPNSELNAKAKERLGQLGK